MQFQYFVAFDLSSSSLQCHSVSFCSCVSTYLFEFYSDFVCAICSIHLSPLVRGRMNQNVRHRKQNKSNQHNFVGSMRVSFFSSGSFVFSSGLLFSLSVAAVACRGLPRVSFFSSGPRVFSSGSLFSLFGRCRGLPRLAAGSFFSSVPLVFSSIIIIIFFFFFAFRSLRKAPRGQWSSVCVAPRGHWSSAGFAPRGQWSSAGAVPRGPWSSFVAGDTGPMELSWPCPTGPMELSAFAILHALERRKFRRL